MILYGDHRYLHVLTHSFTTRRSSDLMLVLSRQRDETIMIGDDIELTVVDIRGDKVRIGIKAPTHVAVHRKEVYDARSEEHTSELQSLMRNSYAVLCLKKKQQTTTKLR